jgi:hypothetical protein
MLKSAMVAMTILGCNCEQNTCECIRTAALELSTVADCQARMRHEIEKTNAEYPLIVAVCESRWQAPTVGSVATAALSSRPAASPAESQAWAESQPVDMPLGRRILVRARERTAVMMSTARDGLNGAAEFMAVPASWVERQISAVENLHW